MEITTPPTPEAPLSQDQVASLASISFLLLMAAGLLCKATSLHAIARWGRLHAGDVAM
ncbi:MAG TPA: hypothetical protein VFR55_14120 [Dehalococcoidia bacterium]|nr:hypothetical protein [Dehalococcoidia bacterium]